MELNHRGEPQETEQRIRSLDTGRPSSGLMPVSKLGQDSETILYPTSNLQPCLFLSLKKKKEGTQQSKKRHCSLRRDGNSRRHQPGPRWGSGGEALLSFKERGLFRPAPLQSRHNDLRGGLMLPRSHVPKCLGFYLKSVFFFFLTETQSNRRFA